MSELDLGPAAQAPLSVEAATAFLREATVYFRQRDTKGEDAAHWANVFNAENCERVIALIATFTGSVRTAASNTSSTPPLQGETT